MFKSAKQQDRPSVKGLYIFAFTPEQLNLDHLKAVVKIAEGMLMNKNPSFKQLMAQMLPQTRVEIGNMQLIPLMHTPQTMQTTLMGWLKKSYSVAFQPTVDKNFFPHGMKDPQGEENFILFYFDLA
jgi:hypothetical protein